MSPDWHPTFGAIPRPDGVRFRLWAPRAARAALHLRSAGGNTLDVSLQRERDGCWTTLVNDAGAGDRYGFRIDDHPVWPDPASRYQPDGVHGLSEIVDPATYRWTDVGWRGVDAHHLVFYELHVGTCTESGTFAAAADRLPHLRDLGVTAIELMPVAAFPGRWNWGYDGAALFAPSERYGHPEDLRRLVDRAHELGLAVFLDVVYNHLGPEGAYLAAFSDQVFSERHRSPWGAGINFDEEGSSLLRRFFVENVLYWLLDYHVDGLRLDATHAIVDDSTTPFLAELASAVRSHVVDRRRYLVAEDSRNLNLLVRPPDQGGWGLDGVWADDLHHEIRRHVAGDCEGYYTDYRGTSADIATTIENGWFYRGEHSAYRGRARGTDPTGLPAHSLIVCLQNHDQIGNRALGERLNHEVPPAVFRAASALVLLAPETPLIFMGQEWAASTPFLFFADHREELGRQITDGRREEFAHFSAFADPKRRARIPDPQDPSTFERSRLRWSEMSEPPHGAMLAWYRALLALRRETAEWFSDDLKDVSAWAPDQGTVMVLRRGRDGRALLVVARLSGAGAVTVSAARPESMTAVAQGPGRALPGGWRVALTSEDATFAPDAQPSEINRAGDGGLVITFSRPGAIVLAPSDPTYDHRVVTTERSQLEPRGVPSSTYRLQLNHAFTFDDARAIVPYLARLGVGAAYTSPFLLARPGSTHGYDISDHTRLNPELGGEPGFDAFVAALRARGLGLVADVVPNHMGIDPDTNAWWREVLENGPCSRYARYFDIDWDPATAEVKNKLLLPILGDQYGAVLERGELTLTFDDGQLFLHYADDRLPINPRQQPIVLRQGLDELRDELGDEDRHLREFLSILTGLHNLPVYTESDPARIEERAREKEILRERLMHLRAESDAIRRHIDRAVATANGVPGRPESFDVLHELLEAQPYRLAYWRTAVHAINYRRFFDINDLAGLRVEDPEVFRATHALIGRLVGAGAVTGLRIDHPDGLFDPAEYFERVQALAAGAAEAELKPGLSAGRTDEVAAGRNDGDNVGAPLPIWVVAEKILSLHEQLPDDWVVHGTTGYNFLNDVNGLFVKPDGLRSLRKIYVRLTGRSMAFDEVAYRSRKTIIETTLASELNVLADSLKRIANRSRRSRDFTLNSLRDLLTEVVACFPVYRTYISTRGWTAHDKDAINAAIAAARRHNPAMEKSLFDFLRAVLLREEETTAVSSELAVGKKTPVPLSERLVFAMKFQQYTGPVQAKGLEDTAFYRYNVLASVNEVGGHPSRAARTPEEFHRANEHRLQHRPFEMLATSTHDSKLGEDARARVNVLSEIPDEWRREVSRWTRMTAGVRVRFDGDWAPSRSDAYRFYQVLVGCWPPDLPDGATAPPELVERLRTYMTKATKEAKVHTSWISADHVYDDAMAAFVDRVLTGSAAKRFLPAFVPLARRVARIGVVNALAQTVLKLASPGVPDFYQGAELWNLNLVDPDNRRAVDYALRQRLLEGLEASGDRGQGLAALAEDHALPHGMPAGDGEARRLVSCGRRLLDGWPDGRVKLWLVAKGLRLRHTKPDLFLRGDYVPLECDSTVSAGLVAFARRYRADALIVIVPRFVAGLMAGEEQLWPLGAEAWAASRVLVPPDLARLRWRNVLTGEDVPVVQHPDQPWISVADALKDFPVALIQSD